MQSTFRTPAMAKEALEYMHKSKARITKARVEVYPVSIFKHIVLLTKLMQSGPSILYFNYFKLYPIDYALNVNFTPSLK